MEEAIFAGGCFWCMQAPFEKVKGVSSVVAGYTGGEGKDPTYEDYAEKGHVEAIDVKFDPAQITYSQLLDVFWRQIDPTDAGGQFVDRGPQYRSAIFYLNDEQKRLAEKSKQDLAASGKFDKPIVTEILKASVFYKAEDYHQDYYKKNPIRYKFYRSRSGRDDYLDKVWGKDRNVSESHESAQGFSKPSPAELKKKLTAMQYKVTQQNGTEPPFKNEYWNNERAGIYVDVVSGEPLFSSLDKFDSGTGWPSFTRPLEPGNIVEREDNSLFSKRTEVRSKDAGFAPRPRLRRRACADRAALLHELRRAPVRSRRRTWRRKATASTCRFSTKPQHTSRGEGRCWSRATERAGRVIRRAGSRRSAPG